MSALAAFETQRAWFDASHAFNAHTHTQTFIRSSGRGRVRTNPRARSFGRGGGGVRGQRAAGHSVAAGSSRGDSRSLVG